MTEVEDPEAEFAAFCRRQHPRLVGLLSLYVGDRELGHDLAQETLARLWKDWRRVRTATAPEAYALRTAVNLAKNQFRRRAVQRRYQPLIAASRGAWHHDPEAADVVAVRRVMAELSPRKRTALLLRYFADQSVADTATAMGVPENTVKTLTRRALAEVREHLALADDEEDADVS